MPSALLMGPALSSPALLKGLGWAEVGNACAAARERESGLGAAALATWA